MTQNELDDIIECLKTRTIGFMETTCDFRRQTDPDSLRREEGGIALYNIINVLDGYDITQLILSDEDIMYNYELAITILEKCPKIVCDPKTYGSGIINSTIRGILYNWFAVKKQDVSLVIKLGYQYNWYAASDARGILASGWHIFTAAEVIALYTPLGDYWAGGGPLKETGTIYWNNPNTGATNTSKFNARGGGLRLATAGNFVYFKESSYFMIDDPDSFSWSWILTYDSEGVSFGGSAKDGSYIRAIKDSTILSEGEEGTYTGNDGKVYKTICIGGVEYMSENLAETKYRNGDNIPEVTNNATWAGLVTGARCSYNNDETNAFTGSAVSRDLAPVGYHLPTLAEMNNLRITIGGDNAGSKLKEIGIEHWLYPNLGATDIYGLKLVGSGIRSSIDGLFSQIKEIGSLWTSNEESPTSATHWYVRYNTVLFSPAQFHYEGRSKNDGLAVRFIKDDSIWTEGDTVTDYDNNNYILIKIGNLVIMAENFRCIHYNNGDLIPELLDNTDWINATDGAMCWYNNSK